MPIFIPSPWTHLTETKLTLRASSIGWCRLHTQQRSLSSTLSSEETSLSDICKLMDLVGKCDD
ncbi:hypothetical protein DPMN_009008 [Dreissena polymorpha]|uniref:Uncharacterized protein n=1 Tax=Dreissena polymorpha TaxID=45954 RepID=A0A9D4MYU2_DREPO|nr:hypothetical protein DPMN_009008 [Dreissena polymorpha]